MKFKFPEKIQYEKKNWSLRTSIIALVKDIAVEEGLPPGETASILLEPAIKEYWNLKGLPIPEPQPKELFKLKNLTEKPIKKNPVMETVEVEDDNDLTVFSQMAFILGLINSYQNPFQNEDKITAAEIPLSNPDNGKEEASFTRLRENKNKASEKEIEPEETSVPVNTSNGHQMDSEETPKTKRGPKKINKWSLSYEACIGCGTTERKHMGKGFCTRCYFNSSIRERVETNTDSEITFTNKNNFKQKCMNPDCSTPNKSYDVPTMIHGSGGKTHYCSNTCKEQAEFYEKPAAEQKDPDEMVMCANKCWYQKKPQRRGEMNGFDGKDFCSLGCIDDYRKKNRK